jgi:hypothetical protein
VISPPLDIRAASRVGEGASLRDIHCVQVEGTYVASFTTEEVDALSWDLGDWTVLWELTGSQLCVMVPVRLSVFATREGSKPERLPIANIQVALRLEYEAKSGSEFVEADIPHFAGITGLMHAWPYVRSDVQWLTTKLRLPPLVLPVILSGHAATQVSVYRASGKHSLPDSPRRALKERSRRKKTNHKSRKD